MLLAAPNKPKRKSRIATRSGRGNLILLFLILSLMAAIAFVIITGISNDNARDIVQVCSTETAQMLSSFISQDISLVRKISNSKAVTGWFADEENPKKMAAAYDEMMVYAEILESTHLFFGIEDSLNEYSTMSNTEIEDFVPFDKLDPLIFDDIWYFDCIGSQNDYTLNIDIDKMTKNWRLWINHKVLMDGNLVGVFCSGIKIPDLFRNIFGKYDEKEVRIYIIDKYGLVQSDNTDIEIYREDHLKYIQNESSDQFFTAALASYFKQIDGFFGNDSQPEIVKLDTWRFEYAGIAPISNTDWSVIVFHSGNTFSGATRLLPFLLVMFAALFLYVEIRNTLINRLVFAPLSRLTRDVSESKSADVEFYGNDRNDEIGELARAIRNSTHEHKQMLKNLKQRDKFLRMGNDAAAVFLSTNDGDDFEASLFKGMEIMGYSLDVDRVQIWQNETIDGELYFILKYQWLSDFGRQTASAPINFRHPYSTSPDWERRFSQNETIINSFSGLSAEDQDILRPFEIKSIILFPLFLQGRFWGFFSFDDCHSERIFSEEEIDIIRSGCLMMINALDRNTQAIQLHQMMREIKRRDYLLNIVNNAATVLLQSETEKFESDLQYCMGLMAKAVGVDRVYIWKNFPKEEGLSCSQMYEWSGSADPQQGTEFTVNILYSESMPNCVKTLSEGNCINSMVRDMSMPERSHLSQQDILSIFILPVFLRDQFWGFVGFDDCHNERVFSENEQLILRSGGIVIANAFLRNEMTRNIYATATKLKAVVANYSGIIWSIDDDSKITLYDGLLLKELGKQSRLIEGKQLEVYMKHEQYSSMITNIHKTFTEGAQNWVSRIDGRLLHARSVPIFDEYGKAVSVVGSFDDVTEITLLQEKLEAALTEAQKANDAKSNFLARMSHEMRTPLNAIVGLSELALASGELEEESSVNLEKISNAGITLLSTVNHILDISKIEAGKFELVPVEYDSSSLLNDAINQSIINIGEKPIEFILDINENLPAKLYGDDLRIKQVLNNLLTNAFKYTKEGKVELSVNCTKEESDSSGGIVLIIIRVSDTGMGIKSEDLPYLFDDYTQMDIKNNRYIQGTGLGLPITQKIIEMMSGTITVESQYKKGSVFTVKFKQKFLSEAVIGAEVADSLKKFLYSDQKRRKNSRMMRVSLPYARVLVVDDVPTNLDVTKGMLNPYGMQVDCLSSGTEAVDAIREEKVRYNAVFMDHMMPVMDGIEATRIIREEIGTDYAKTVPIIALTANAIAGNEEMFLSKGFQAFISKPIDISRLDAVIREWIRDKELEKKLPHVNIDGKSLLDIRSGKDRRLISSRRSGFDRRLFGEKIPEIDISRGIEHFGGDEKSYLQILRSYVKSTRSLLEKAGEVNRENLADYETTVHGIKGSSRSICAFTVGDKAEALEKAAKEGNFDFIKANNADFLAMTAKLVSDLEKMLGNIDADKPIPRKDKIDPEALKKLLDACEQYDMDGVDAAMEEIERFEYDSDNGLCGWLRTNVEETNFAQIKEKLVNLEREII